MVAQHDTRECSSKIGRCPKKFDDQLLVDFWCRRVYDGPLTAVIPNRQCYERLLLCRRLCGLITGVVDLPYIRRIGLP